MEVSPVVSDPNPPVTLVRIESGPNTGDSVYVVDRGTHYEYVSETLGEHRVEFLEIDQKSGAQKVRVLR